MNNMEKRIKVFSKKFLAYDFSKAHEEFKIIGKEFEKLVENRYLVTASVGKGQKSVIPWICFFNREVTKSAQKGIYIVILFKADMSGFVLSLNQGYTYYKAKFGQKHGKEKLGVVTKVLREEVKDKKGFGISDIQLLAPSKNALASGYEAGHILGKEYSISNLNMEKIEKDLLEMFEIYDSLINKIGVDIDIYNTRSIISEALDLVEVEDQEAAKSIDNRYKEVVVDGVAGFNVILGEEKDLKTPKKSKQERRARKVDYEKVNKSKAKIGYIGETIALDMIKNRLASSPELLKKLEHTSIVKGDGLGYDIYYKDIGNKDKYVEVKATTGPNPLASIMITENELEFSRENSENYELFILYNLDLESKRCNVLIKKGAIEDNFGLRPRVFSLEKK